jgi:protein-glutamine gamma-glutamyltransferase
VKLAQAIRQANRPGPPEHSVALRVAATGAVAVGIVACWGQAELSGPFAAGSLALVVVGNVFSYRRRRRAVPYVKLLLAAAMLGAFAWFFVTMSADASAGDIASVEGPLAALFTAMQAAHSFDVPARRDLGFSLVGSATLMAVAAAQAVDLRFGGLVVAWAVFVVIGLAALWGSMAGGARSRPGAIAGSVVSVVAVGGLLVAFLPSPRAAGGGLVAPSDVGGSGPTGQPSRLVPAHTNAAGQVASASGPTGVGGFLGFAGPLDTAVRASLGNQVVMQVRADRPTFWIAETFDSWSGQSWTETPPAGERQWDEVTDGPPFAVPPLGQETGAGAASVRAASGTGGTGSGGTGSGGTGRAAPATPDYQTFYLATSGSDLVLHASQAAAVWFPSKLIYVSADGTIKEGTPLGAGSIYTVLSDVTSPTGAELASVSGTAGLSAPVVASDLQLPHAYPRVAALARRITAGQTTTYGKVTALERWIGAHTKYTTDIPPLRPGQDTVVQFLFGTRRGYCEQISTSLAVMLRTLGIPAREATGYVPGPYDPLTDLYEVQAKDAHAWVQVWFPGYGWQSFDPTAYVPLANPTPADALGHDLAVAIGQVPVLPTVPLLAVAALVGLVLAWRRSRPATWRAAVTRELEKAAARAGLSVGPADTLGTIASRLDRSIAGPLDMAITGPLERSTAGRARSPATDVALATELAAWREDDPAPSAARALVRSARRVRRSAGRAARRDRLAGLAHGRGDGRGPRSRARRPTRPGAPGTAGPRDPASPPGRGRLPDLSDPLRAIRVRRDASTRRPSSSRRREEA